MHSFIVIPVTDGNEFLVELHAVRNVCFEQETIEFVGNFDH